MANPPKANDHSPLADAFYEGAAGVLPPKHGDYSPRSGYWHAGRDIAEPGMAIDAGGNADWLKAKKS